MIVAEQKSLEEILGLIEGTKRLFIVGCGECVTVCQAGGEKEVATLAAILRMKAQAEGRDLEVTTSTSVRQCEPEYLEELANKVAEADAVLSLACGVGVQFVAERFSGTWVVPGLNTKFGGGTVEPGVWEERCGFCGECILYKTGGICPVTRCSKSLLNGPCGGSEGGKCEVSKETDCGWQLIYDRLKALGKLDLLFEIEPPKDWSKARDGGPRRVRKEEAVL